MLFWEPESEFIESIGFNLVDTLQLIFKNGSKYTYVDFPPEIYQKLRNAVSVGKFYQTQIKGKYLTENAKQRLEAGQEPQPFKIEQQTTVNQKTSKMADKIIHISIDVTKIKKEWLLKGAKGTYANLTLLYNEEQDQYGNNGMIVQSAPKEIYEKDKTQKGPILGNCKEFKAISSANDAATAKPVESVDALDDLPF